MKILFIAHRMPYPPDKGDKLRAFNIIKHLAKKHEIYLLSLYDHKNDAPYAAELKKICKEAHFYYIDPVRAKARGLFSLLMGRPASVGYFNSGAMKSKVDGLLRTGNFDVIFAYSSSMAQYAIDAPVTKIMDFVDCDSEKWKQYADRAAFPLSSIYAREHELLRAYEKNIVGRFDRLLVVTEAEKREFEAFTDTAKFTVLSNGVDTEFFHPLPATESKAMVFTGAMDYYANIDAVTYFCTSVFPLIRKGCPEAEFYIIGHRPTREVRALAAMSGVFVTGSVPDVREYLRRASVAVMPLRIAQGVQNKILEAMSSGLPVVTTSKALAGLRARPGEDVLAADEPKDFARAALALLDDGALRKIIGERGRRYVEESHNWEKNLQKLDGILK